jgi:hypothetical protein
LMLSINSPCPLSHPVPGWCLRISRQSSPAVSACQSPNQARAG